MGELEGTLDEESCLSGCSNCFENRSVGIRSDLHSAQHQQTNAKLPRSNPDVAQFTPTHVVIELDLIPSVPKSRAVRAFGSRRVLQLTLDDDA
ncbi:hypothetical protein PC129_g8118 [Phytophthora cactorum]|uniref:Uncharacterized protein n=1 Tax=Phytophthora cactorum TaxID=29920 RepID=A0A8T1D8I1_9STRA|nr:hypothetical protein Pcac1_g28409 [Phytophthora cactorum]KAG2825344.1 hypothetical protein PC111_g9440 [Phytophthora cactorum]KAG2857630.1 hypothetical protein PC113_g10517 [Phytophthora cactorum]KAG2905774.1 hypothetical protein PC114_g11404 [Phytophthora cactorum]KAG2938137.1 hypothetical protein PC117_g11360 [Phytophthora cactorum]